MCEACNKPVKGPVDRYMVQPLKRLTRGLVIKPLLHALFGRRLPQAGPAVLYVDTHVHTCFSHDSFADVEKVLINAARRGLDAIAITDHNEIRAVPYARQLLPRLQEKGLVPEHFLIIPGEEVSSAQGHIGALFCEELIPAGLSVSETIHRIKSAGGLTVAVHPFGRSALKELCRSFPFDAIEIYNQSILLPGDIALTIEICQSPELITLPRLGASDAHNESDVGASYTTVTVTEVSLQGIRQAIESAQTLPHPSTLTRFLLGLHRLSRRLRNPQENFRASTSKSGDAPDLTGKP